MELSNKNIKQLKGLAHHRRTVVQIGREGVTEALLGEVSRALSSHELVKVAFVDHKDERRELAKEVAVGSDSHLVAEIGNKAIFYRALPLDNPKRIQLG